MTMHLFENVLSKTSAISFELQSKKIRGLVLTPKLATGFYAVFAFKKGNLQNSHPRATA